MAYLRWERNCDWYIFWERTDVTTKPEQRLAVWHCDCRGTMASFTYVEISAMLESSDFSAIPGYADVYKLQLRDALSAFIEDVDLDFLRQARGY